MKNTKHNLIFLLVAFITLSHLQTQAAEIVNIKGNKALLDISDLSNVPDLREGDKVFALNSEGKRKAILQIKQIKNQKAVAEILKGQVTSGMTLQSTKSTSNSSSPKKIAASQKKDKPSGSFKLKSNAYGVLGGLNSNTMSVKVSSETVKLAGSSFSLKGFYQQRLDSDISVRLGAGYDSLIASGTLASGNCKGSTNCKINVSYLGLDALVKYSFLKPSAQNPWEVWAGGGLGFLIALSKSSTVLDQSKISTNQNILFGGGVDYHLNSQSFIPVEVLYGLFPTNSTTSASQLILKVGYGLSF